MKVKKYEKIVSKILLNKFTARNSDYVLYAFVLLEYGVDINTLNTKDFLKGLNNKKYPSFEGIGRCRRKLQENHPEFRGTKWHARHKVQEKVKNDLNLF